MCQSWPNNSNVQTMKVSLYCPDEKCENHAKPSGKWYHKIGYYKPKHNNQPVPRYKCKACGKTFSTTTCKDTRLNQKKPAINQHLFKLLVSGVSLRRSAKILDVQYNTVVSHFRHLAEQAREAHRQHLRSICTTNVAVDELETFLHTRAKPLSVCMVVRVKEKERHILGFGVAPMPTKGKLAKVGQSNYNWVNDGRSKAFQSMLMRIRHCFNKDMVQFKCDGNSSYPKWITNVVPHASVSPFVRPKNASGNQYDELFAINNTFARMRHDMNRLGRKTWSTTKSIKGLEDHIWLYVAWNNGYAVQ